MNNNIFYFASVFSNRKSWRAFFGKNRLLIPDNINDGQEERFNTTRTIRLTQRYLKQWNVFFNTKKINTIAPYSFHWPAMMKFYIQDLLYNLKVNNTKILHIGHEAELVGEYSFGEKEFYTNRNKLVDICLLKQGGVILVTDSLVKDKTDNTVFKSKDYFFAKDIPVDDSNPLMSSKEWNNTPFHFFSKGFSKREEQFKKGENGYNVIGKYCSKNLCRRFGFLSGALSIDHQFRLPTRLIHNEAPYLQGMCTGNIVFKLLADELNKNIKKINIYYNNKMYFDQTIEIRYNDSDYEVYDENETMIAFGSITL